jgi:autotransporter-associated beta strand protein
LKEWSDVYPNNFYRNCWSPLLPPKNQSTSARTFRLEDFHVTSATWGVFTDGDYDNKFNWGGVAQVPGINDTAFFGTSHPTSISLTTLQNGVGAWVFNPGSSDYSFSMTTMFANLQFYGAGIVVNGGSVTIDVSDGGINFFNNSTAGEATLILEHSSFIHFWDGSTAGSAKITNHGFLDFPGSSTGGDATIKNEADGIVDFSVSVGPRGNNQLTVGSIEGDGTYDLGNDQLTVGQNGRSTKVSGQIDDGGEHGGSGASLVKVGKDALTLSGVNNTYSGGTTLKAGTLAVAAVHAAGTGAITFAGKATLKIGNAALSSHHFSNAIDAFGNHDFVDLSGLHFHSGATATYHKASHHLTVRSGGATDSLTLHSPHGTDFGVASDHHGGTDVFLLHA